MREETKRLIDQLTEALAEVKAAAQMAENLREFQRLHEIAQRPSRYGEFIGTELQPMLLYLVPEGDSRAEPARRLAMLHLASWARHRDLDANKLSPNARRMAAVFFDLFGAEGRAKPKRIHFELSLADDEAAVTLERGAA